MGVMDNIKTDNDGLQLKYVTMLDALQTLQYVIEDYQLVLKKHESPVDFHGQLDVYLRDALIKRFEYCADHIWKYYNEPYKLDRPIRELTYS